MTIRAIRGATTARDNTREGILEVTKELLVEIIRGNHIESEEVVSAFFTVTSDLNAAFAARAARLIGWQDVALLDALAPSIQNDLPRCIRVLIHWDSPRVDPVHHVYLHEAKTLRPDRLAGSKERGVE